MQRGGTHGVGDAPGPRRRYGARLRGEDALHVAHGPLIGVLIALGRHGGGLRRVRCAFDRVLSHAMAGGLRRVRCACGQSRQWLVVLKPWYAAAERSMLNFKHVMI